MTMNAVWRARLSATCRPLQGRPWFGGMTLEDPRAEEEPDAAAVSLGHRSGLTESDLTAAV